MKPDSELTLWCKKNRLFVVFHSSGEKKAELWNSEHVPFGEKMFL